MLAKYGLPEQVSFCRLCCISNQRPNSCNEFGFTADSKKETIGFDADGVCSACRFAERKRTTNWAERERELRDFLDQHRSRTGAFDCVVPGSGGKDSFMAAHLLKHKYGMHPLLCTWAAAIYTEWGWRNLIRWQSIAPHILITPNRETHRLLTRLALDNLFHPFAPFVYGQKAMAPKLAALHNIKLVFYGEDEQEYGNPRNDSAKRDAHYYAPNGPLYLGGISTNELKSQYALTESELEPYLPANPALLEQKKVDVRYLGYYERWHPQSAYYYACEHGDFEAAPERTPGTYSKYNSLDDKLDDLHYWTTFQKFGIGRATYDSAQEIRSGDITREEGVALVRRYDGEYPERFEAEVLRYLSVPGFVPASKDWLFSKAAQFRSAHLWDGDTLRHQVA